MKQMGMKNMKVHDTIASLPAKAARIANQLRCLWDDTCTVGNAGVRAALSSSVISDARFPLPAAAPSVALPRMDPAWVPRCRLPACDCGMFAWAVVAPVRALTCSCKCGWMTDRRLHVQQLP